MLSKLWIRTSLKIIVLLWVCLNVSAPFSIVSAHAVSYVGATNGATNGAPNEGSETIVDQIKLDEVNQYWNDLMMQYRDYFPNGKIPSLTELIQPGGEDGFSFMMVFSAVLRYFLYEVLYNGKLLATIVILSVFCTILQTMQSAFERNTISTIAYSICYIVLMIMAVNSFSVAIGYAKNAIEMMIHFMIALVPLLLSLLVSIGNLTTVTLLHPIVIFMVHTIGTLIYTIVFPLLFFSAVLHIVSALSVRYKVSQLADLLRTVGVALLGIFSTVFLGVVSIQGGTAAIADGVTVRTAKYVTGHFVPVVGRMFTDAADTVMSASMIMKNAIGLFGAIIIIMLCAFPAIKILALSLIYQVAAAIAQPLGDSPISQALRTIGKSMIFVFAALAVVGLMFFMALTIIIATGNISMMMR